MKINKITSIYFSPNGTTKQIVNKVAKGTGIGDVQEVDLTVAENRSAEMNFDSDELVIIGFPVYADRLPALSNAIFKNIKGNNTPVVAVVSYGNRAYGDALLESKDNLTKSNMKVVSAAAVVAEHCFNASVATNRPDEKDDLKILDYANQIREKIKNTSTDSFSDLQVKGNFPYRTLKSHLVPTGDDKCTLCGLCAENCPTHAIHKRNYRLTDDDICLGCGRCVNICPTGARAIRNESFIQFVKKLEEIAKERKEIEVFI